LKGMRPIPLFADGGCDQTKLMYKAVYLDSTVGSFAALTLNRAFWSSSAGDASGEPSSD